LANRNRDSRVAAAVQILAAIGLLLLSCRTCIADPLITNCPANLTYSHCDPAAFAFEATWSDDADHATPFTWAANLGEMSSTGETSALWTWDNLPQSGFETLEVQVQDASGAMAVCTVNLTITNAGPVITHCPSNVVTTWAGGTATNVIGAEDGDCDDLTWTAWPDEDRKSVV
jgi:hypothetical protein